MVNYSVRLLTKFAGANACPQSILGSQAHSHIDQPNLTQTLPLQKTPRDRRASLLLHAYVDPVMALLMQALRMEVPPYIRMDAVVVSHAVLPAGGTATGGTAAAAHAEEEAGAGSGGMGGGTWGALVAVHSVHGQDCSMPMVAGVKLRLVSGSGKEEPQQPQQGVKQEAPPSSSSLPPQQQQPTLQVLGMRVEVVRTSSNEGEGDRTAQQAGGGSSTSSNSSCCEAEAVAPTSGE